MSEAKHTPGDWFLNEADGTIRSRAWGESDQMGDYQGVIVCDLSAGLGGWPDARPHAKPETLANARLIAAAPDLYSALRDLLDVIAADALIPESVSCMQSARAALAKAASPS